MRNNDGRQFHILLKPQHKITDVIRHDGIDHGGRLIVKNAFRVGSQRSRYGDGSFIAGCEISRVRFFDASQIHFVQEIVNDALFGAFVFVIPCFERKFDVLADGQRIEQRSRLEDHRNFSANVAQVFFGHVGNVFMRHDNLTAVGFQESHDVAEAYGFAYSASSDDGEGVSFIEIETYILQDRMIEGLADVSEFEIVGELSFRRHGLRAGLRFATSSNPPVC